MKLYSELAAWWPLFSPPDEEYAAEADFVVSLVAPKPRATMLDLGCGGGNMAFHLKQHFAMTLVDLSSQMLDVCRALNSDCESIEGDMRSVRLGRTFDAVMVHDAITYALDETALRETIETAAMHCRPGGIVVLLPDEVRETFAPSTDHGGEDGEDGRGMRWIERTRDPDPTDTTYEAVFEITLHEADGSTRVVEDRHTCGLFPRDAWLRLLDEAGLRAQVIHDPWGRDVFRATKQ